MQLDRALGAVELERAAPTAQRKKARQGRSPGRSRALMRTRRSGSSSRLNSMLVNQTGLMAVNTNR